MDTYSEEWRHECEARTTLGMPLLKRQAHLTNVQAKRGIEQRTRLEDTMRAIWIERQVDKLLAMPRDDDRMAHLLKIEQASNKRTRDDVEGRLSAMIEKEKND